MNATPSLAAVERVACHYCALPIVGTVADTAPDQPQYCCFGCRFAAAIATERGEAAEASGAPLRLGLAIFFSMNVMVFTMFLWSQPEEVTDAAPRALYDVARYLCLLFALPVLFLLGPTLADDAWQGLTRRRLEASLLLLLGVLASYTYSIWSVFVSSGHVYFEVGVVVLVAATWGRWLEAQGKLHTTRALRELQTLLPQTVRQLTETGEQLVPLAHLQAEDRVRIAPGERIAVDGLVERGRAAVDQQMVTGESVPVEKEPGDHVYSGTFNLDGELVVRLTAAASSGTLQRLIDAVLAAVSQQASYQRLADSVASWFLPVVALLALATGGAHAYVLRGSEAAMEQALLAALAVVVISCPCALGLATPLALWAAIGCAAREQVLFRNGNALAKLAAARVVCFDKTGTLTTGTMEVEGEWYAEGVAPADLHSWLCPLAKASNHPAAQALAAALPMLPEDAPRSSNMREIAGRGMEARSPDGIVYRLGSLRWFQAEGIDLSAWQQGTTAEPRWQAAGLVLCAEQERLVAAFALGESLRPDAAQAIAALHAMGLKVVLLSGDRQERVDRLAQALGIRGRGELLPADKLAALAEERQQCGPVVMVGDGLNDAPALAAADCGLALGCGADLSRDAASVCLLGNQLLPVAWSIALARAADRTIRWNLLWAFGYNAAGIPLAMAGWVNPIFAAVFMAVSSVLVTTGSLRLAQGNFPSSRAEDPEWGSVAITNNQHLPEFAGSSS